MHPMKGLNIEALVGATVERRNGKNGEYELELDPVVVRQQMNHVAASMPLGQMASNLFRTFKTPYYRAYFIKTLEWEGGLYVPVADHLRATNQDRDTELQLEGLKNMRHAAIGGFAIDLANQLLEGETREAYLFLLRATNLRDQGFRLPEHWLRGLTPVEKAYIEDAEGGLFKE